MRRPEGVTIIAVYQFIVSLFFVIGACGFLALPMSGAFQYAEDIGRFFGWLIFGGLSLLTLGGGIAGIVAGWGLLRLKSWARWLTVVLAVLSLILFPIGTVIGALIIWYLLQDHVRLVFEAAGAADASPAVPAAVMPEPVEEKPAEEPPADEIFEEDPPYVIPPELDPEAAAQTVLDAEVVEEQVAEAEATVVSVDDSEAQTLIAQVEEVAEEVAAAEEAATPETIILSEEELAEAQEDDQASDDEEEEETA